jgi:hypothetical protein
MQASQVTCIREDLTRARLNVIQCSQPGLNCNSSLLSCTLPQPSFLMNELHMRLGSKRFEINNFIAVQPLIKPEIDSDDDNSYRIDGDRDIAHDCGEKSLLEGRVKLLGRWALM